MRPSCDGCGRPCSACLCPAMPAAPLQTGNTRVIIMQHPLETRRKLATVPILSKCLHPHSCEVIVGRKFRKGCSQLLDHIWEQSQQPEQQQLQQQVLLLFPAPDAISLPDWLLDHQQCEEKQDEEVEVVLLVVDATWQHAKEMVSASMEYVGDLVTRVCLPFDKSRQGQSLGEQNAELILRKEPYHGFLSTMEAVARALGFLDSNGLHIEQVVLSVLHRMVSLQTAHLLPH